MRQQDITYQDKLGELRLDISHPNSREVNFIFVEGASDIKLFRKFFDLDKCKVENIPGGKTKLEECVSTLLSQSALIIGIRDADFLHLNNEPHLKENIFLTDFHDIEMLMISQEDVLNALLHEYTEYPKQEHLRFKHDLMKSIEKLSCLKWLNDSESIEFTFTKVGFQDLISFSDFDMGFTEYLQRVISKSQNANLTDNQIIKQKVDELAQSSPDLMQLTNGHDLLNVFAKYFHDSFGHKGVSDENIASACRMIFTAEHFQMTALSQDLNTWAIQNNTKIF